MQGMEMQGRSGKDNVKLVGQNDEENCLSCWCASCTKPFSKVDDVPLWDKICCCCAGSTCLCGFDRRSGCLTKCCIPVSILFLIFFLVNFLPREVSIEYDQYTYDLYHHLGIEDRLYTISFNPTEESVTVMGDIPVLITNENLWVTAGGKANMQIYYPWSEKEIAVKQSGKYEGVDEWSENGAAGGMQLATGVLDNMNCKPKMKCTLNGDCGEPLKKGETKANQQATFATVQKKITTFSGSKSLELFEKLNDECGQCLSLNEADCTGTAKFYVQGKLAPSFSGAPDVIYIGPEMVEIECKYVMPNPGWV